MNALRCFMPPDRIQIRPDAKTDPEADLADAIADDLARALPAPSLIERDRDEADRHRREAMEECERLETALVDLDAQYESRRSQLVTELTEARQARSAAAIWSDALHHGAVQPEEEADD